MVEALGDGLSLTDAIVLFPGAASVIELADSAALARALAALLHGARRTLHAVAHMIAACDTSHHATGDQCFLLASEIVEVHLVWRLACIAATQRPDLPVGRRWLWI